MFTLCVTGPDTQAKHIDNFLRTGHMNSLTVSPFQRDLQNAAESDRRQGGNDSGGTPVDDSSMAVSICQNAVKLSTSTAAETKMMTLLFDQKRKDPLCHKPRLMARSLSNRVFRLKIESHPLVCRYVKVVYQIRPAFSSYQYTWNDQIVLEILPKYHPVKHISLKDLTLKLVTLVAVVTGPGGGGG